MPLHTCTQTPNMFFRISLMTIDRTQWDLVLGGATILEVTPNLSSHDIVLHELAPYSRNLLWHPVTKLPQIPDKTALLRCPEVTPLHGIGMTTATISNSLCQIPWDISRGRYPFHFTREKVKT